MPDETDMPEPMLDPNCTCGLCQPPFQGPVELPDPLPEEDNIVYLEKVA